MRVILFRHGIAEDGRDGLPDAERVLTPRGIERTMAAARGLARLIERPQAILTSPKTRAAQTAAIIGDVLDIVPQTVGELSAESPGPIVRMLRGRGEDRLLLVGHEPSMSRMIEMLCHGKGGAGSAARYVALKKAGAAMIEAPLRRDEAPGRAVLHWLFPPRALRMLAKGS